MTTTTCSDLASTTSARDLHTLISSRREARHENRPHFSADIVDASTIHEVARIEAESMGLDLSQPFLVAC